MRIVLVYPPMPIVTTSLTPPVGLAYIASVFIENNIEVKVVASDAEGLDVDRTVSKILEYSPDIVGFSISTPALNNSLKIIRQIKERKPDIIILSGGPHPTLFPDDFIKSKTDFVVRGEGENTVSEFCGYLKGSNTLDSIKGFSYVKNGIITHNPDRELIEYLDSLPLPTWDLFPLSTFKSDFRKNKFTLPLVTSRGCPSQCTFCYKGIFGNRFRVNSPERIIKELEILIDKFKIEEFAIIDDNFTADAKRAAMTCDLMIAKNISIPWTLPAGIRVTSVTKELMDKLRSAGCYRVAFGIESGNQEILNSVKKGISLEQVRKAVKVTKGSGIEVIGYFMIGNLEETEETINQTITFAVELDPDYAQFTKAIPYPGTAMYTQLKNEKRLKSDTWDTYDYFLKKQQLFNHKNLSDDVIDAKITQAYKAFYYRPKYILNYLKKIGSIRDVINLAKNTFKFLSTFSK